jgi:hypothetical protein
LLGCSDPVQRISGFMHSYLEEVEPGTIHDASTLASYVRPNAIESCLQAIPPSYKTQWIICQGRSKTTSLAGVKMHHYNGCALG